MSVTIDIRSNVDKIAKEMREAKKQIPYATSLAINETLDKADKDVEREVKAKVQNPTSFTTKSTFKQYSNKNNKPIAGTVGVKDIQAGYLKYVEEGGTSPASGKAKPIPTTAYKNKYGNLPKSKTSQIDSNPKMFSGTPNGGGRAGGIYLRAGTKKKPKLKMVATWRQSTQHSKRMRIGEVVRKRVDRDFVKILKKKIDAAMKS